MSISHEEYTMILLKYLFFKYLFLYKRCRLYKQGLDKTLPYVLKQLESFNALLLMRYTSPIGLTIVIETRFKNAGDCLFLLASLKDITQNDGYIDSRFVNQLSDLQRCTLDEFLVDTDNIALDISYFVSSYVSLLSAINTAITNNPHAEKQAYFTRRLNTVIPSLLSINEGLFNTVK